jgi:hypothetical protein
MALGQASAGQPQIACPYAAQAGALQLAVADRYPPERALEKARVSGARAVEFRVFKEHRVEIGPVELAVIASKGGRVRHVG